jgi:hypothetical protein
MPRFSDHLDIADNLESNRNRVRDYSLVV